jgi:hypothetical protein
MREIRKQHIHLRKQEILLVIIALTLLALAVITLKLTAQDSLDSITGNAVSRVYVTGALSRDCNLTLQPGLNLVSFFCINLASNRTDIIQNFTQLNAIFSYEESNTDRWKSYNPALPSWVIQDLTTMSRTEGYWINMSGAETIIISGGLRIPTNVNLVPGWNLVGYPTNNTESVNTTFLTITGNFTEVRTFNAFTQAFISHIPPSSGGLTQTEANRGYWINATTSEVWVID